MESDLHTKNKWFYYTVIIGLIPVATRILLSLILKSPYELEILNVDDIAFFGLVLNITNLNQLENIRHSELWKSKTSFNSILFIFIFSILFTMHFINEASNKGFFEDIALKVAVIVLGLLSLIYCSSIFSVLESKKNE